MLQIDHRESFDAYSSDGTHALKIVFKDIGEIDFIVAPALTPEPYREKEVRGQIVNLETPAEIIAKKIFYRGASMQPRDMFDIACVRKSEGDARLIDALTPFKDACSQALNAARKMNPRLAETVMSKLLYRPNYSEIPSQAQQRTIELLEDVCAH
jgi:hypothetical protein